MVSLQISPLLPDKGWHPPSEQDLNPGSRVLGLNQNKETRKVASSHNKAVTKYDSSLYKDKNQGHI